MGEFPLRIRPPTTSAGLTNVVSLLVAFGALAGVLSWIAGPSRGLLWTARDGELPQSLTKTNKNGVQKNILLIQGGIVTLLSLFYIFIKNVNVAWFLLSALTVGSTSSCIC